MLHRIIVNNMCHPQRWKLVPLGGIHKQALTLPTAEEPQAGDLLQASFFCAPAWNRV